MLAHMSPRFSDCDCLNAVTVLHLNHHLQPQQTVVIALADNEKSIRAPQALAIVSRHTDIQFEFLVHSVVFTPKLALKHILASLILRLVLSNGSPVWDFVSSVILSVDLGLSIDREPLAL